MNPTIYEDDIKKIVIVERMRRYLSLALGKKGEKRSKRRED